MPTSSVSPVAIITGAGSGIGRETAIRLSKGGYAVVLVGRRNGALEETLGLMGEGAQGHCISVDMSDAEQAASVVAQAVDRFGRLDALINNAGTAPLVPLEQHTPHLIQAVYAVNTIGPACAIAAAWKVFMRQASEKRADGPKLKSCIVNVSTMGTMDPFPGFFAYAGSKGALNVMAKLCANEGRHLGIRAFAVAPGAVETEMLRGLFTEQVLPRDKTLTPARVAEEIVSCVLGERDQHSGRTIYMSAERGVLVM